MEDDVVAYTSHLRIDLVMSKGWQCSQCNWLNNKGIVNDCKTDDFSPVVIIQLIIDLLFLAKEELCDNLVMEQ